MNTEPISEPDRRRKRGAIVFQIVCYGYLITMFSIQLHMWATRGW